MKGNIEENYWFNNKQVISVVFGVSIAVFYATYFYFSTNQIAIEHDADMMHIQDTHGADIKEIKADLQTLENRLDKKIKLISNNEDRIVELEFNAK